MHERMQRSAVLTAIVLVSASAAFGQGRTRGVRRSAPTPVVSGITSPADCGTDPESGSSCRDGGPSSFVPLRAAEVEVLARNATAAVADPHMTVAITDRAGRVLAILRNAEADPANDDLAVGLARTASFFSHNQAPLSSRTVRFISGVHFPPGVKRAGNAALYGIENTNRGCDFNVEFNPGKCIPRATSVNGLPCNAFDTRGCGTGIVTGKPQPYDSHEGGDHPEPIGLMGPENPDGLPVNPGGIPIFRVSDVQIVSGDLGTGNADVRVSGPSYLLGGIGVAGISPDRAEFAAFAAVALAGSNLFPAPSFPLPEPGRVFIDGIRLPFVEQGMRPAGAQPGSPDSGTFVIGPNDGGCAANRYLVGPSGSAQLSTSEVDSIVRNAFAAAQRTRGLIRLPLNRAAKMAIAISDLDGNILALYRMPDSTIFSIDVAVAKARNVVYFSDGNANAAHDMAGVPPGTAVTNRTIGFGSQPLFPAGIDFTDPGPFFDALFVHDLDNPCSQGSQPANANQNGIVFFPGSIPLYRNGTLIGGLGISGDGVEQDDYVSYQGAEGFRPPEKIWADRVSIRGVRLNFLKFPRHPEGVTEEPLDPFDEP